MNSLIPGAVPVTRRKLSDEVLERLLKHIRSGEFKPGDLLPPERTLMEVFGVGRPAIREAVQTLQHMGLVSVVHGEGARVVAPSADSMTRQIAETVRHLLSTEPQSLEDLKQARLLFEVSMVRIAAERATPQDVQAIRHALEGQREATQGDLSTFLPRDMAFHRAIASVSGNSIYRALSQAMFQWLEEFHTELVRLPGSENLTLQEHQEILQCIAAHDANGAARAMTAHLTRANALYRIFEGPPAVAPAAPPAAPVPAAAAAPARRKAAGAAARKTRK